MSALADEHARALRERDAESLSILINRRLFQEAIAVGDVGAIGAVVAEMAPGWDFIDATAVSDARPRIELSCYDPGPL